MRDLASIEARIWSLLEPYRRELEPATIYGMPSLRWPGAAAHDYFASVRTGKRHVTLILLVADRYPEALDGVPADLRCRTGRAAFNFEALPDATADDLALFLATLYRHYRADHAGDATPVP